MSGALTILDPIGSDCEEALTIDVMTEDSRSLEERARALVAAAHSPDLADLCREAGLTVAEGELPKSEFAMLLRRRRVIVVRANLPPSTRLAAVAHELAHDLLGAAASHAAVWYLALALLIPPQRVRALRATGATITPQDLWDGRAPKWAALLRARLLDAKRRRTSQSFSMVR